MSCSKPNSGAGVVWVKISLSLGQGHTRSYEGDWTKQVWTLDDRTKQPLYQGAEKARKRLSGSLLASMELKVATSSPIADKVFHHCSNCAYSKEVETIVKV